MEEELKRELYPLIYFLSRVCYPGNRTGRPPKVDRAMAAFLAVAKEHGNENTYQELAASGWVEFLGISEVHYTTIHKAVKRLPPGLLADVQLKNYYAVKDRKTHSIEKVE